MSRKNDRFKQLQLPWINDTKKQNKTTHPNHQNQKEGMGGRRSALEMHRIHRASISTISPQQKIPQKIFAELKILETKHVEAPKMIKHVYI